MHLTMQVTVAKQNYVCFFKYTREHESFPLLLFAQFFNFLNNVIEVHKLLALYGWSKYIIRRCILHFIAVFFYY